MSGLTPWRSRRTSSGCGRCRPCRWSQPLSTAPTPAPADRSPPVVLQKDPLWFKHAIFYEIVVRGFYDSNNDGTGDIRGLIERLDYLEWLGVDCLWVLPWYESPLRDGGYDISDYLTILPEYGTVQDVAELIEACHARGMRVIVDMVINHTSDAHPWFQESRQPGSAKRDWYVWSDTDERYADARIIFVDTERSNWTWDPVAEQYYWHRFFSHQPDLNYDNPEVQEAILDVVRFWLSVGLDGLRLDAVPYLFERKLLLAEANQWPEDVVDYFGDGDECQMAFHFPVMPRMFMALRREESKPIVEIMENTPAIPDNCQWGIFLRNHDELTLEMVTDEERDYMYNEYARDPRMKMNVGIRRRLAPLLDNGRRPGELFHSLLFSLPGSPVMYYGDEIGMGDNIYLGDRDGVRTPMQWTPDRNAGFSRGDFAQLYLPIIMDPVYGYQSVNIEAQQRHPNSMLHWVRNLVRVRKQYPVFGAGTFRALEASNPKVLAFLREDDNQIVMVVANMSGSAQPVELNLQEFSGRLPVELLGGTQFPALGDWPYLLTLGPHGFYWFLLTEEPEEPEEAEEAEEA